MRVRSDRNLLNTIVVLSMVCLEDEKVDYSEDKISRWSHVKRMGAKRCVFSSVAVGLLS